METVFKVGDRVYHHEYSWGEIIHNTGLAVKFSHSSNPYSLIGCPSLTLALSFTEYDLVNGGFSQERPLPKIEVDTLMYVRDSSHEPWFMRYFSHFNGKDCYCFDSQRKSSEETETTHWLYYSLTNPLENESNKK